MTIDELDEKLAWRVDFETGIVSETSAHRVGSWRIGKITSLAPPTADIMGRGLTQIDYRATSLSGVRKGDFVMFQNMGEHWIAVYEVEAI